ncbi:MAG: hypothetical protein R3307_03435 [Anaerolineales bacterium]|nr:hypothetical protein [Anaerolineales bacterium]
MKKVFLTLLAVLIIIGALAGAGYWGYRIGFADGATDSGNRPSFGRSYHMNPNQMPFHRHNEGFKHGFGFNQHSMMRPGSYHGIGMGFGYFSPLHILWNAAILALIIWFAYWLFTKSGWQVTRKTEPVQKTDSDSAGN